MRANRALILILRAGVPALFVSMALSAQGMVSVRVWIGAAAVWIGGTLVWDFVVAAELGRDQRRAAWQISGGRRRRTRSHGVGHLRALSLALANAQATSRAHANVLRPRLTLLAQHYVPIRHGFNVDDDPLRAGALLGDVGWLIDPKVNDRTPTSAEIVRFLELITEETEGESSSSRAHAAEVAT